MPLVQQNQTYTYHDYLQWDDDERWELIGGVPFKLAAAPATPHQRVSMSLSRVIDTALLDKKCEVFAAPTDVILSDEDVVQPDLLVVCEKEKVKKQGIFGAPDLVIEIVSPDSGKRDRWDKKSVYEKFGVKEYLIVEPEGQYIEQYILSDAGKYELGKAYSKEDEITLKSIENISINLSDLFE